MSWRENNINRISDAAPIAYAHYRVIPEALLDNARKKLPKWMLELSESFDDFIYITGFKK